LFFDRAALGLSRVFLIQQLFLRNGHPSAPLPGLPVGGADVHWLLAILFSGWQSPRTAACAANPHIWVWQLAANTRCCAWRDV